MSWKRLTSRTVFANPWFEVREDKVINPGGGENLYGHIHFKNRAVAILPLAKDSTTWLVGQDRYTLNEYSWELPMGGAPLAEAPLEAAKRELKEETGLSAGSWQEYMKLHTSNSVTDEVGIVFVARDLDEGSQELEETENIELRRLPLKDAIAMVMRGEITDAISVAALLKAREFL
ncbi:MAG: NUDIX hydrolase [Woeseia sp.]